MMLPGFIQAGTFAGSGEFYVGLEGRSRTPFECSVEITKNRESFKVEGYYRLPSNTKKRRFSGTLSTPRNSLASQMTWEFNLDEATLGKLSGVLSSSRGSVLIQASSGDGQIQISQRWDALPQEHCFHVHGIVVRAGESPIDYSLSFGNVDPRLAKSNVMALRDSA
jgi:hypothetical protein